MRRLLLLLVLFSLFLGEQRVEGQQAPKVEVIGNGIITDAVWLPDDRTLIVGGARGLWVYDAQALDAPPQLVETDFGPITRVFVGGKTLAAGHGDGSVTLWAASLPLTGPERLADAGGLLTMSANGQRLVTSKGKNLDIRDVASHKSILTIPFGSEAFAAVGDAAISDNGRWLTFTLGTASCDAVGFGTVVVWDIDNQEKVGETSAIPLLGQGLAISPDGKKVAMIGMQGMYLWAVGQDTPVSLTSDSIGSPSFSADGKTLMAYDGEGLRTWDTESQVQGQTIPLEPMSSALPNSIRLSKTYAASVDAMGQQVYVWRLDTGKAVDSVYGQPPITADLFFASDEAAQVVFRQNLGSPFEGPQGSMDIPPVGGQQVLLSPNVKWQAWRNSKGGLVVAAASKGAKQRVFDTGYASSDYQKNQVSMAISPDSRLLAITLAANPVIDVWDIESGTRVEQITTKGPTGNLKFSGTHLAASNGSRLMLWNTTTWQEHDIDLKYTDAVLPDFGSISTYALAADRVLVLSNPFPPTEPCYANVYRAEKGTNILGAVYQAALTDTTFTLLTTLDYLPTELAMNPGGTLAVIGDAGREVHLISPTTGHDVGKLDARQVPYLLAFDSSGKRLAAAGDGGFVVVWSDLKPA